MLTETFDHHHERFFVYVNSHPPPEKKILRGEVPGEQPPPIVGRAHGWGLLKDLSQIVVGIPIVLLRRLYQGV
jgi:hypothetical protein